LVIDDENIRRPKLPLHQVFAMQEAQGLQSGTKQVRHFIRGEWATGKNPGQSLIRILHHYEEEIGAFKLTAA
jgi:hypothetical protein